MRAVSTSTARRHGLARQGVPVCVIHAMLVHSMVQATAQYSHLSPEGLGKAMEKTFGRS